MGFVSIKKRGVRHMPRWGVGALITLDKHGVGLAVFRELVNAALPPPSTGSVT